TSVRGSSCPPAMPRRSARRSCGSTSIVSFVRSSAATRGGASRRASRWSVRPPRRSRCTKSCSARAVFHSLERREVTQCHALVAALLEQPREVEVGLGDRRLACERRLIFAHGLVDRTLVLEHDTEIE